MIEEFNWWLLLLGLVVGGGLTWLVLAETRRREQDLEDDELADEAAWLEARMAEEGRPLPAETIERVVQLHRTYLAIVPPGDAPDEAWLPEAEAWLPEGGAERGEGGTADAGEVDAGEVEPGLSPEPPQDPGSTATGRPEPQQAATVPPRPAAPEDGAVRHEVRGG